ncbi:flagellin [Nocardioides yefusunii]|uniref:Flagellin n=1 Tax=Nocardioides yefusunii TaxID=2500546 RepID=A0ABW1QYL1_9ACTN|nr:flagellin [Nocardioides yefusunii]
MSLRINTNTDAINSYRNLSSTQSNISKSLEKLSSGLRINRAADDAAGLAISEGLRGQIGGLKIGARNAQDGISLAQTAEGALTEVHSMLQRMNVLAVQTASGGQSTDSKAALASEFDQLELEIARIETNTKFNGDAVFGAAEKSFQVGFDKGDVIKVSATALAKFSEGTAVAAVDITDSNSVQAAITEISTQRAELGAIQNRFEHTINNVNVTTENLQNAESRIRDTDMAEEMVSFTKNNILSQAGTSMLAQANQATQNVLSLLR